MTGPEGNSAGSGVGTGVRVDVGIGEMVGMGDGVAVAGEVVGVGVGVLGSGVFVGSNKAVGVGVGSGVVVQAAIVPERIKNSPLTQKRSVPMDDLRFGRCPRGCNRLGPHFPLDSVLMPVPYEILVIIFWSRVVDIVHTGRRWTPLRTL
jgi:hypothetical protein